jgi:hypothetical protein
VLSPEGVFPQHAFGLHSISFFYVFPVLWKTTNEEKKKQKEETWLRA